MTKEIQYLSSHTRITEYLKGLGTTSIVTILVHIMNIISIYVFQVNAQFSSIVFLKVIGVALGYTADIMFAKKEFNGELIDYTNITMRIHLLWNSFFSLQFIKFILISILSVILFSLAFTNVKNIAQRYQNKPNNWKYIIATATSVITFILIINPLRFLWAYRNDLPKSIDIGMFVLIGLIITLYGVSNVMNIFTKQQTPYKIV